jgi:hypothetical protein
VGLNTRGKRLALIARHRDPYERAPSPPPPERHIDASEPGEVVQTDCFFIGRLSGSKGSVWQYTAIGGDRPVHELAGSFADPGHTYRGVDARFTTIGSARTRFGPAPLRPRRSYAPRVRAPAGRCRSCVHAS